MFDTNLAVVGNVLNAPEWRRVASNGTLVATFRIASHSRRWDRENGRWIDGKSFRVRVTAWRRLAEGVAASITTGDPVVVFGRLFTRDWRDDKNVNRVSYEMEAVAIGHDLARGRAKFFRTRSSQLGAEALDAENEAYVRGELTVAVDGEDVPVFYGEGAPLRLEGEEFPRFAEPIAADLTTHAEPAEAPATEPEGAPVPEEAPAPEEGTTTADEPGEQLAMEVERYMAEQEQEQEQGQEQEPAPRRARRSGKKEAVAA